QRDLPAAKRATAEEGRVGGEHVSLVTDALDPDPPQRPVRHHRLGEPGALAGGHRAGPYLRPGPEPEQPHAAEAAQELVPAHLLVRKPGLEQRCWKEAIHPVVNPEVALPPRDADLPGAKQPVEERTRDGDLAPAPGEPRGAALDEGASRQGPFTAEPLEDGRGNPSVPLQQTRVAALAGAPLLPVDPVDRKLLDRKDVQGLVVGLEELPLGRGTVEPALHPAAAVVADAGGEDEVVVPRAGHLERIELDRAQLANHAQDRLCSSREGPRRGEKVTSDEETARLLPGELERHRARATRRIVRGTGRCRSGGHRTPGLTFSTPRSTLEHAHRAMN